MVVSKYCILSSGMGALFCLVFRISTDNNNNNNSGIQSTKRHGKARIHCRTQIIWSKPLRRRATRKSCHLIRPNQYC